MSRDPLSEALRALPRERASEGFTAAVLRRLDEPAPARGQRWLRPVLAAAAIVTLVVGLWLARTPEPLPEPDARARLVALQAEHARLAQELEQIRELAREEPRREIYLGGSDRLEVVLDVGWPAVRELSVPGRDPRITPARYEKNGAAEL